MLKGRGIITAFHKNVLESFAALGDAGHFYLTGGTALAEFYFAHRKSYDLDFFTSRKELVLPLSHEIESAFRKKFSVKIIRRFESFAGFEFRKGKESIKFELAYDSPFRFEKPVLTEYGVNANDYKDLITDKMLAFYGRSEPRDAADLYFILQKEDFWKLSELAGKKDAGFDLYWMAVALERCAFFPDDLKRWPVEMLLPFNPKKTKKLFLTFAKEILSKIKK